MTQRVRLSFVAGVCALLGVAFAVGSLWTFVVYVPADNRNGDGRPDVWRVYDHRHQLSELGIDTNFDGRSDVQEYYEHGALVRRESDRDFNDHVDLREDFDVSTREHTRSVVDVDFDGTADLLVLFQDGEAVFSKWAHPVGPVHVGVDSALLPSALPRTDAQLAPLEDPFAGDRAVRSLPVAASSTDCVGLSTSGGLPACGARIASPLALSSDVSDASSSLPASAAALQYSPRGPPPSRLQS